MPLFPRISAVCVSLAYLAAGTIPCAMPDSIVSAASAGSIDSGAAHTPHDSAAAEPRAGHAHHDAPKMSDAKHADHMAHAGHAAHAPPPSGDAATHHEHLAENEPVAQLNAPCQCGCTNFPDSTGNSSARIGFALARSGWVRALELDPPQYPAALSAPPQSPVLASDPVPG